MYYYRVIKEYEENGDTCHFVLRNKEFIAAARSLSDCLHDWQNGKNYPNASFKIWIKNHPKNRFKVLCKVASIDELRTKYPELLI